MWLRNQWIAIGDVTRVFLLDSGIATGSVRCSTGVLRSEATNSN